MNILNPKINQKGNFKLSYLPYTNPHTPLEEAMLKMYLCWTYKDLDVPWVHTMIEQVTDCVNNMLLPACEEGNQDAIYWMFMAYLYGLGVERNEDKASEYLKVLAEYGYPDMQCELGKYYKTIDWGSRNREMKREAVKWFTKAAKQGNIEAMCCLGECYRDGSGVDEDQKKAVEWFTKAAKQGHEEAMTELAFFYERGCVVEKDLDAAAEWYDKAGWHDKATRLRNGEDLWKMDEDGFDVYTPMLSWNQDELF